MRVTPSSDNLKSLISKMLTHREGTSKVMLQVIKMEQLHGTKMLQEFEKWIVYFEHSFEVLVNLVYYLNYLDKKRWPDYRVLQYLIINECLCTLYSGFERLVRGFYGDSLILLRSVFEGIVRIVYISYHSDNPYTVFLPQTKKGEKKFNVTNFLEHELKVDWKFIYAFSSSYSHSNSYQVLSKAIKLHRSGRLERPIGFELKYDESMATIPINMSTFLIWGMVKFAHDFLIDESDTKLHKGFYENLKDTEEAIGALLAESPKVWAVAHSDLLKIFEEIKLRERQC